MHYSECNKRLLRSYLVGDPTSPVFDFDVSDEGLAEALHLEASEAADELLFAVKTYLRDEGSHLRNRWEELVKGVQPELHTPEWFGFLIATCRIEWEKEKGQFQKLFQERLQAPVTWIQLFPDLWKQVESWVGVKNSQDEQKLKGYRALMLPQRYSSYERIGNTVGFIFPRRPDRNKLREMFSGMPGRATLSMICGRLAQLRGKFSQEFWDEAHHFLEKSTKAESDLRALRFLRVLQRVLSQSQQGSGNENETRRDFDIKLACWLSEDQVPSPWLLLKDGATAPQGFAIRTDAEGVEGWKSVLQSMDGSEPGQLIFDKPSHPITGMLSWEIQSALKEGLLVLKSMRDESIGNWLDVLPGNEFRSYQDSMGCLISKGYKAADSLGLKRLIGPNQVASDWAAYVGKLSLPEGLSRENRWLGGEGAGLRFKGGIRWSGQFLAHPSYMPVAVCEYARTVLAHLPEGNPITLEWDPDLEGWKIPFHSVGPSGSVIIEARTDADEMLMKRTIPFRKALPAVLTENWPVPKKTYWISAPHLSDASIAGGVEHPFIEAEKVANPPDTTAWETIATWLGPRVGDVSDVHKPGFDWQLTETLDEKRLLVFAGDPDHPISPDPSAVSSNKGANRLWRRAFASGAKLADPKWEEIRKIYSNQRVPEAVKKALGREPEKFDGPPIPPIRSVKASRAVPSIHKGVFELEHILRARVEGKTGAQRFSTLLNDVLKVFGMADSEVGKARSIIRTWQEIGLIDVVVQPWVGNIVFPRRPRFCLRSVSRIPIASLIGLTSKPMREDLAARGEKNGWTAIEKSSCSPMVPSMLELRASNPSDGLSWIQSVTSEFGLAPAINLPWSDPSELPPAILSLDQVKRGAFRYSPDELPIGKEAFKVKLGESLEIKRIDPRGGPSAWVIGPVNNGWAMASSQDWAMILASLQLKGRLPYEATGNCFRRVVDAFGDGVASPLDVFLPLEVGRLLSIISPSLPGPTEEGYFYPYPTSLVGRILAKRLDL